MATCLACRWIRELLTDNAEAIRLGARAVTIKFVQRSEVGKAKQKTSSELEQLNVFGLRLRLSDLVSF